MDFIANLLGIAFGSVIYVAIIRKSILINPNIVQIVASWFLCIAITTATIQEIFIPFLEDIREVISSYWLIIGGVVFGVLLLFKRR